MRLPRNVFRLLIVLEAAALIAVIIFAAVHMGKSALKADKPVKKMQAENEDAQTDRKKYTKKKEKEETDPEPEVKEIAPAVFSEEVQSKLASMTLEEKAAQLFFITPEALTHSDEVEVAGESTKASVNNYPVGGLVYSASNFKNKEQTQKLLSGVQGYSNERIGLPMFLSVEEPGGSDGSPLASANGYGVQPAPADIGAGGNPEGAAQASDTIASYLAEEGFNLNILFTAELSGETPDARCYGADAANVSAMLAESVNASRARGVRTAVGTFPGKGAAGFSKEDWKTWEEKEALVYKAGIDAGTNCMILSNVVCEGLTGDSEALCSLSKAAVYYLRNDMAYTGIIMTDVMTDEAVTGRYSSGEAAVEAIKNGVNVIYRPANFEEAYQAVVEAAKSGEIPAETLDQAAGYVLTQKMS